MTAAPSSQKRTAKATEARIRGGVDRKIAECLATAPQWTPEQRARVARALQGGAAR